MSTRRLLEIGGFIAGAVLIAFGAVAIYMAFDGRSTVRDSIKQEQIYFGNAAEDPAVAKHASQWSEEQVKTGEQARAFAKIMHEHALDSSGGLVYSQLGRFVAADAPSDPKGTSDEAQALKDEEGKPVANAARNTWVTANALSTALNMSYMAEQLSIFALVVGIALLLSGVGFVVLAWFALGATAPLRKAVAAGQPLSPATGH